MSKGRGSDRKRLVLRILQFSPLIPLIFNGIVWISVPGPLRGQMLAYRSYARTEQGAGVFTEEALREAVEVGFANQDLSMIGKDVDYGSKLQFIGERIVVGSAEDTSALTALYEEDRPFAWSTEDPMFDSIAECEAEGDVELYAFAVIRDGLPSLVASSENATDLLYTPEEAELALLPIEYTWAQEYPDDYSLPPTPTVDPSMMDESWEVAWYSECDGRGELAPFPNILIRGGGGSGGERRMVLVFSLFDQGALYASIWLVPQPTANASCETDDLTSDTRLDNIDVDHAQRDLDEIAEDYDCNGYLVGPVEARFIPIWCGDGNEATALALAEALRPGMMADMEAYSTSTPDEISQVIGDGRTAIAAPMSGTMGNPGVSLDSTGPTYATPTVVVIGLYPAGAPMLEGTAGAVGNAVRDVRIWITLNMHWLLNTGIALLAMTLVVSPSAFIFERNLIARERLVEEMSRVQRDAHDKVYNRLSALSKRVEMTSDEISTEVATSLSAVADDIRATVADLQEILGDTRRQTAEMIGADPLRAQLEHVCHSQAQRLGINVSLDAPKRLPSIPSQVGWDLQCVLEEAITNAVKHGDATDVQVAMDADTRRLVVTVRDNGHGGTIADIDSLPEESTGLRGIRVRLEEHGGTLDVRSDATGTVLSASIPLGESNGTGMDRA